MSEKEGSYACESILNRNLSLPSSSSPSPSLPHLLPSSLPASENITSLLFSPHTNFHSTLFTLLLPQSLTHSLPSLHTPPSPFSILSIPLSPFHISFSYTSRYIHYMHPYNYRDIIHTDVSRIHHIFLILSFSSFHSIHHSLSAPIRPSSSQ